MSQNTHFTSPAPEDVAPAVTVLDDHQEMYRVQHRLAAIVDALDDAILSRTLEGIITTWNPAAERLFGYTAAEIIGRNAAILYPPDHLQLEAHIFDKMRQGMAITRFETVRLHKDGTPVHISATITSIKNAAGCVIGSFIIARNITEHKALLQAKAKARAADEAQARILEMIARGEPIESVLDAVVRLIEGQLPDALCSVLRLEGTTLRHGAAPSLPDAYCRAIDGVTIGPCVGSCGTAAYRKQAVIVTDIAADPLWAAYTGLALAHDLRACWSWPILAQDGEVLGTFAIYHTTPYSPAETEFACVRQATNLVGIALERHRREEALRQSEERFALAMEGARDGLWDWNMVTGEVYFSPRYKTMLGYAEHEMRAHVDTWVTLVHADDLPGVQETLNAYFERRLDTYEVEFRMRHKEGHYRWILARGVALFNAADQPYRMAGSHTDITEKKHSEQQLQAVNNGLADANAELEQQKTALEAANIYLEALAATDGLTHLKNHGAFQDRLREEYERAIRYHAPLSVVLLDVDKFKNFNDTHGHPAGDSVLKQVADILKREARSIDTAARYGGEEFVVILPETDTEGARQVAERMREAIAAAVWEKQNVTASFGVSTLTLLMPNPVALVTEADTALYRSKSQGRNRVTHFTDPIEEDTLDTRALASFNYLVQTVLTGQEELLQSSSEQMRDLLLQSYDATIASWSRLLDLRDKETEGHGERVAEMMVRLAEHLGMSAEHVRFARWGAWLHDIGKMAIPDAILRKPGPLTEAEWAVMRQHTTIAQEMLKPIEFLQPAVAIPYCHHEKWDGSGYPRGLKGEEIPLLARLFAVIDVYDSLRSERPFRKAWSEDRARDYLLEQAGAHFDPCAVEMFFDMLNPEEKQAGVQSGVF